MITDEERQVGDLLRAVEAPRSNADVARAVTRGRQRRRRRGVAAVAAATVVVAAMGLGAVAVRRTLAGPEPVATAACQVVLLPNLPDRNLKKVLDLDPSGRYVTGAYHRNRIPREESLVRWDGTAEPVGLDVELDDGEEVTTALADGTVLAGSKRIPSGAWLRPGKPVEETPTIRGLIGLGWILPDGRVAGWTQKTFLNEYGTATWTMPATVRYPYVYPDGHPDGIVWVPTFKPLAIGATGVTVGIRWDPDRYVVRHPDGRERELAVPDGLAVYGAVGQVTGDWAVGTAMERGEGEMPGPDAWLDDGGPVSVRWNLATGAVDRIAGATGRVVPGVSADGTVAYADGAGLGMLRAPNGKVGRLPMPGGRHLVDRIQISDDGRTVLGAVRVPDTTDVIEAIRWRC
jgi:hypothetical protein